MLLFFSNAVFLFHPFYLELLLVPYLSVSHFVLLPISLFLLSVLRPSFCLSVVYLVVSSPVIMSALGSGSSVVLEDCDYCSVQTCMLLRGKRP